MMADGSGDSNQQSHRKIGSDVPMCPNLIISTSASYSRYLMTGLYHLRRENSFSDFNIKVGHMNIPCHRVVLAAASPFFLLMFESNFKETECKEVTLDQYDADILLSVIEYIYTGNLILNDYQLETVIDIAEFFGLHNLKQECIEHIANNVDVNNCIYWFQVADKYQLGNVMARCIASFTSDIHFISSSADFKYLNLEEMLRILEKCVESVEMDTKLDTSILIAALKWKIFDPNPSNEFLKEMLTIIPLKRFDKEEVLDIPTHYPEIAEKTRFKLIFNQIRTLFGGICLIVLGGCTSNHTINDKCWRVFIDSNIRASGWKLLTTLPKDCQLYFTSICQHKDGFAVLGGMTQKDHDVSDNVHMFNVLTLKWKKFPNMLTGRYGAAATCIDSDIFVFGGRDKNRMALNTAEYMDSASQTWTYVAQRISFGYLPVVASSHCEALVICNSKWGGEWGIFRGKTEYSRLIPSGRSMFDGMSELPLPYPTPPYMLYDCEGAAMTSADDCLYFLGGSQKIVMKGKISNEKFINYDACFRCKYHHNFGSLAVNKQTMYVSGGYRGDCPTNSIEVLDIQNKKWLEEAFLPVPLGGHSFFVFNAMATLD